MATARRNAASCPTWRFRPSLPTWTWAKTIWIFLSSSIRLPPSSSSDSATLIRLSAKCCGVVAKSRCSQSEDFAKVQKNISRYKEQKSRKFVTLNKEKFLAERAELNAEKEQQKQLEELNGGDESLEIKRDYYLDEALAITVDFLNSRQLAQAR